MNPLHRLQTAWRSARKPLDPALARARQRYQALAPRERRLVAGAALLLGFALVFVSLIEPPLNTVRKLQAELPALRAQAAAVADLTAQAAALRQRSATPAGPMPARAELAASLERAGLAANLWSLGESDSGGGVELSLEQAPSSALLRWLDGAGRDWSLAISHVDLTRAANANGRPLPGLVNGKVVLMPPQAAGSR
ncbi:type II secretion system protein GspM [Achromobacter deleyi]|uniref:type II secretion system protein GspM n=1 Tax=Achromobacter deleyi TaxID=1353891 RepID=UPI0014919DB2|nr:type II secretion system protein GspM [Achromobacter deleyi]QVQ28829.1 type II secretion system protein M [Achromobacter deleyi]UIP18944.1 type II secretion system protein M [Achromobacter deleyi]